MARNSLVYAVLYDDGTWAGLFSTEERAFDCGQRRRKKGEPKFVGIFRVHPTLTGRVLEHAVLTKGKTDGS